MKFLPLAFAVALSWPVLGQKSKSPAKAAPAQEAAPKPVQKPVSRVVEYRGNDLVSIGARMRYTTILIFPTEEIVSEVSCGDRDYWVIDVEKNLVHVKPAQEGSATNMNVVTASGNVYSFLLSELGSAGQAPDLRVVIELKDAAMRARAGIGERPSKEAKDDGEARAHREQLDAARQETAILREAVSGVRVALNLYPNELRFPYEFPREKAPFRVEAIFHDSRFTYIRARPDQVVAVYEWIGKKPSLVEVEYRSGLYVVKKVLDQGYLAFGKHFLVFARRRPR